MVVAAVATATVVVPTYRFARWLFLLFRLLARILILGPSLRVFNLSYLPCCKLLLGSHARAHCFFFLLYYCWFGCRFDSKINTESHTDLLLFFIRLPFLMHFFHFYLYRSLYSNGCFVLYSFRCSARIVLLLCCCCVTWPTIVQSAMLRGLRLTPNRTKKRMKTKSTMNLPVRAQHTQTRPHGQRRTKKKKTELARTQSDWVESEIKRNMPAWLAHFVHCVYVERI